MYLPVQSMTRAPLGICKVDAGPTSVIRSPWMITTALARSLAERPQLVTSTTVPPVNTSGEGATVACDPNAAAHNCAPANISRKIG